MEPSNFDRAVEAVTRHEPVFDYAVEVQDTLNDLYVKATELLGGEPVPGALSDLTPAQYAFLCRVRSICRSGVNAAMWAQENS